MATLPTQFDIRQPGLNPSRNVINYEAGLADRAQAGVGQAISQAGDTLSAMAALEQEKLDTLKVNDNITQLMQKEIDLKQQAAQVKNGDVLNPDYRKGFQDRYKQEVDNLSAALTPAQKEKFHSVASRRGVEFDASLVQHSMVESDNYYKTEAVARQKVWQDTAATSYSNPAALQDAVLGSRVDTARELARQGYTDPADPVVKAAMAKAESDLWGQVLDTALTNNDVQGANQIYAAASKLLTNEQRRSFESRIKPANNFAEGQQLALEAHDMLRAGKSPEDVQVALVRKASSKAAYDIAAVLLTDSQQAAAKQSAEDKGTVLEAFSRNGGGAAAMAKVLASPEYGRLTEAQQGEVANFMRENSEQALARQRSESRQDTQMAWARESQQHARQSWADDRKQKIQQQKGLIALVTAVQDPKFAQKSDAELYALAPTIGLENVTRLVAEKTRLTSGVKSFSIDPDIINAAVPKKLLDKDNKDKLNAFKGLVQSNLMDWKDANPGKIPDSETQRKIARSALSSWVEVGGSWFGLGDKEHPAYEPPPDAWVKQLQGAASKKGKVLTPAQVDRAWRAQSIQGQ